MKNKQDTHIYLGEIPEAKETYNVIGNMNEYGLAIGETTFTGRYELRGNCGKGFLIDYGSLIYITLQRCKTASEAVDYMVELANTYGYYSTGESFTIADSEDIWVMDFIGKGTLYDEELDGDEKVCYVAMRMEDGYIGGHANQARITTFDLNSTDRTKLRFSKSVKSFAVRNNFITEEEDFDFTKAYNPLSFMGTRFCDARVFTFFNRSGVEGMDKYNNYILGKDNGNRLPLFVKPPEAKKISVHDLEEAISDHYEGTVLDMQSDVGSGPYLWGNRYHPLTWNFKNPEGEEVEYFHERPIATQQTGWSFIAVLRSSGSGTGQYPLASMFYFGVDDSACSPHVPIFPCITRLPACFESKATTSGVDHETYDLNHFSFDSSFWVNNMVSNLAYQNWQNIGAAVQAKRKDLNEYFDFSVSIIDEEVRRIFNETANADDAKAEAVEFVTKVCNEWATMAHDEWLSLYESLFIRYLDLVEHLPNEGHRDPIINNIGYPQEWYDRIARFTGNHYLFNQPINRRRLKYL